MYRRCKTKGAWIFVSMLTCRINDDYYNLFKEYAKTHGMTLTDFVVGTLLEKIEAEHDLAALLEALKNPNPMYYTMDEVREELGF